MKKRAIAIILALLALSLVLAAPGTTIVYITKTGGKYHRDGCSYLKKSKIQTTLYEAVQRGYEPCKVCKPPVLTQEDSSSLGPQSLPQLAVESSLQSP